MRNEFQFRKKNQLEKKDKSDENKIDKKIKKLCEKINKNEDYYTTSSCSGRIALVKGLREKSEDAFLFKTHNKINFNEFKKMIKNIDYKDLIYFKQEPFILHVACSNTGKAEDLLDKARDAGIKKKGIITTRSRIVAEIAGSEKLELPIINKKLLVDDGYLKLLIMEANSKLERSWDKMHKFYKLI